MTHLSGSCASQEIIRYTGEEEESNVKVDKELVEKETAMDYIEMEVSAQREVTSGLVCVQFWAPTT